MKTTFQKSDYILDKKLKLFLESIELNENEKQNLIKVLSKQEMNLDFLLKLNKENHLETLTLDEPIKKKLIDGLENITVNYFFLNFFLFVELI